MDFIDEYNLDTDKIKSNTISHEDLVQTHLQDKDYQRIYLETSLEEFANDGNADALIGSLQHVLRARGQDVIMSLANDIGIDSDSLSDIADGKTQPQLTIAFKLIHGLGYKIQLKQS